MEQAVEPTEAVIISGPRRGEIVTLLDEGNQTLSPEALTQLDEALDQVLAALDRLSAEVRATTRALRGASEPV